MKFRRPKGPLGKPICYADGRNSPAELLVFAVVAITGETFLYFILRTVLA